MRHCNNYEELFSSYIDGELALSAQKDLEAHLDGCPGCRETVGRMQTIRQSMTNLSALTVSADFDHKLHQRISQANSTGSSGSLFPDFFSGWKMPAVGFAAVLALVSFFTLIDLNPDSVNISDTDKPILSAPAIQEDAVTETPNQLYAMPQNEATAAEQDSTNERIKEELKKNLDIVNDGQR